MRGRTLNLTGWSLLLAGIFSTMLLAALGYARFLLFIVFPVFYGSGAFMAIPVVLILLGIIFIATGSFIEFSEYGETSEQPYIRSEDQKGDSGQPVEKGDKKYAGILMIGPIPILFGNDRKLLYVAIAFSVAVIALFVLLFIVYH